MSVQQVAKALALSLFGALLASGGGPSFAEAVNRTGIPTSIVQELVDTSRDQLLQVLGLVCWCLLHLVEPVVS